MECQAVSLSTPIEDLQEEHLTSWVVMNSILLAQEKVSMMEGVASAGELEREVQEFLDQEAAK